MNQCTPLPGTVFRFGTEVEEASQPAESKTLTNADTRQEVETSTFGPSRRSGCAAAEPYPPERQQKHNPGKPTRNQAIQSLNLKPTMI